jgi:hypothetical protein
MITILVGTATAVIMALCPVDRRNTMITLWRQPGAGPGAMSAVDARRMGGRCYCTGMILR